MSRSLYGFIEPTRFFHVFLCLFFCQTLAEFLLVLRAALALVCVCVQRELFFSFSAPGLLAL